MANAQALTTETPAPPSEAGPEPPRYASVICFGGEDWWYHNRGHFDMQMMRRLSKAVPVLYINSIMMRKPVLGRGKNFLKCAIRKLKSMTRGLRDGGEGFPVFSPVTLPIHHLKWAHGPHEWFLRRQIRRVARKLKLRDPLVWVNVPSACDAALRLKRSALVYQRTDRYEDYPDVDAEVIRDYDLRLKQAADITLYVHPAMYEAEKDECRNAFLTDHGVDYEHFGLAHEDAFIPEDIRGIPRPIAGFFGDIEGHSRDLPLLERTAELLPGVSFVFVGHAAADTSKLAACPNVWMLGQKPYTQVPHYGKCFSVCLMPMPLNEWTDAINPIKLKEYLALGKAIVSTPFREVRNYGEFAYLGTTPEEFAAAIRQALDEDSDDRVRRRRESVKAHSWDARVQQIMAALGRGRSDA